MLRSVSRLLVLIVLPSLAAWSTSGAREEASVFRPEVALQNEVVAGCRESLARGAARRTAVSSVEEWRAWREETLAAIRAPFPALVFSRNRDLRVRTVSRHDLGAYRIENVLFESLPGWEVNASLYLPAEPGVYPAVVCPTGHSNKLGPSYQQPAQVFARNGYLALSFDPPGAGGEIAQLNDHFTNGLVGYLTGLWSQSHFVLDAMACLDYLQTRGDVDQRAGLSMTGVSGGGLTSFFTALLDDRVAFVAPVCCLAEHESLHLQGLYTSCPEQFGPGYIAAGLDYVDYIAALAPRPCLVIAGQNDEVFDVESTRRLFEQVHRIYKVAGAAENCGLFVDDHAGHAYTVAMANETVRWLNRFIKRMQGAPLPLTEADVPLVEADKLLCHPRPTANMYTINRDEAWRLRTARMGRHCVDTTDSGNAAAASRLEQVRAAAREILGLPPRVEPVRVALRSEPRRSWHVLVEEVDVQPAEGVHLPGLFFSHLEDRSPRPGLLWLDDQGKWAAFRHEAFLSGPLRMYEADCRPDQPRILSLDVSGLGSLAPEPTAYDLAGWNDVERILTYLSIANARPIMGLRVRDALCGLAYLRSRPEVDPGRVMVGGRGVGAIVALHAALLAGNVRRLLCLEMLSHYGALAEQYPFSWPQSIFIPGVLQHYDLPEVVALLAGPVQVHVFCPRDAQHAPLTQEQAETLYADALMAGACVRCGVDGGSAVSEAVTAGW